MYLIIQLCSGEIFCCHYISDIAAWQAANEVVWMYTSSLRYCAIVANDGRTVVSDWYNPR